MDTTPPTSFWKKWGPLVVLSLALAIIVIDTTLLNVSISAIIRDLHTDIQKIQWVITAYSLMLAAFTITGGRLGDIFGRKKMFMLGAILFAVGSFLASISTSVGALIWGESIVEGIGAVLMLPATSSLLVSMFKGRDRAIAFGVWGGIAAAASAIGPILGGYLTTNYSWRWGFRINIVVVILLLFGSVLIKEARDTTHKRMIDWMGVFLSSIGLLGISFGIIEASTYGWWYAKKVFMIGSLGLNLMDNLSVSVLAVIWGLVFLLLFIIWELYRERSGKTPLVSMRLFANTRFTSGLITTAAMSLGQAGIIFSLPVFFQAVRGLDAFHTGLGLLPLSISLLIAAPFSAFLVRWMYPRNLILMGLSINVVAYLVLIFSISPDATVWTLAPGLFLYGIGMGFVIAQISNITLSAVHISEAGEASGLNNTMRQIGSTLGSAIIGSVLITMISSGLTSGVEKSSVIPENVKAQISERLSSQSTNVEFSDQTMSAAEAPDPITKEIGVITHNAITEGNKYALITALVFSLLAVAAAWRLPREKNIEKPEAPVAGH